MSNPQQMTTPAPPPPRQAPPSGPVLRDLAGMSDARNWGEALAQDLKDFIAGRRCPVLLTVDASPSKQRQWG